MNSLGRRTALCQITNSYDSFKHWTDLENILKLITVSNIDTMALCGKMNITTLSVQQFTILDLKPAYECNHACNTWLRAK